jgi:hypothetical protein
MSVRLYKKRPYLPTSQHTIYLGTSHVVEVKKGGLYIGIYVITETSPRRGVILPHATWTALQESIDIINLGIEFARGTSLSTVNYTTDQQKYGTLQGSCKYGFTAPPAEHLAVSLHGDGAGWCNQLVQSTPSNKFYTQGSMYQNMQPSQNITADWWGQGGKGTHTGAVSTEQWYAGKTVDNNQYTHYTGGAGPVDEQKEIVTTLPEWWYTTL